MGNQCLLQLCAGPILVPKTHDRYHKVLRLHSHSSMALHQLMLGSPPAAKDPRTLKAAAIG